MNTPAEASRVDPLHAPDLGQRAWHLPASEPASTRAPNWLASGRNCWLASLAFGAYGMLGLAAAIGQRGIDLGVYRPTQFVAMFFHSASHVLPGFAIIAGFLAWHSRTARVLTCSVIAGLALDATLDRWSLPSIDHSALQLALTGIMLVGSVVLWRRARLERQSQGHKQAAAA